MSGTTPFYEKNQPLQIKSGGALPHWYQDGKIMYITFRLADSLPQSEIEYLRTLIDKFNNEHPKPWSAETANLYRNMVGPRIEELLDKGYGECILKNERERGVLISALDYYSKDKYEIIAYVIMPNHVHLLLRFHPDVTPESVLGALKSYSAHIINRQLHRKGKLWKDECFDHIVRSSVYLKTYITYIENNPQYIPAGTYTLYVNPEYK